MSRPKSNSPKKVPLHATIEADQLRWLKSQAKRQGVDVSTLLRQILFIAGGPVNKR